MFLVRISIRSRMSLSLSSRTCFGIRFWSSLRTVDRWRTTLSSQRSAWYLAFLRKKDSWWVRSIWWDSRLWQNEELKPEALSFEEPLEKFKREESWSLQANYSLHCFEDRALAYFRRFHELQLLASSAEPVASMMLNLAKSTAHLAKETSSNILNN